MLTVWPNTGPIAVSVIRILQRRAFVHCDVVGLVALDFILRVFLARVVGISFLINISCVHFNDLAADLSRLRVPRHVIPYAKFSRHLVPLRSIILRDAGFKQRGRPGVNIKHSFSKRLCSKDRLLL
jgi:hypothetical protein